MYTPWKGCTKSCFMHSYHAETALFFCQIIKDLFLTLYGVTQLFEVQSYSGFPHTLVEDFTLLTCRFLGVDFCWLVVLFSTSQVWPDIAALTIPCC